MELIDRDAIPWLVDGVGKIPVVTKEEIDEMPTVDAIPVEFIEKRAKAYDDKAEEIEGTEFIYAYLSARVLNRLIADWRESKKE